MRSRRSAPARRASRRAPASCSAPGSATMRTQVEAVATIPYARPARLSGARRRGPCRRSCSAASAARRSRCWQGRAHYYEHGRADVMKVPVRTLARARLRDADPHQRRPAACGREMAPGSVMLITDHINFTGQSPLFGETGNEPLRRHGRRLRRGERAAPRATIARRDRRRRCTRASTSGSAARSSRRRPRSAPPRRSAPTRSACRRCPR